ncbi:putative acyl-CoA synthetase (AMP-forming)/AMP-acid ligase II-like protein [Burkholderia pseudomallei]|nr:putative acyl-CoA synthetase (AMP-forming)/AMP-acid ligase II-like protein [Burkholderia pseudomallei]KGD50296.1 putative acyl-CoA synthetase (AMP-forming)/AMP-acid ligase II-like protein [Burkholderia pseudomallei]
MRPRSVRGRVTVRVPGGPARQPCVLYSETGSSAQAGIKLYGSIGLRSDFTAPVRLRHTSGGRLATCALRGLAHTSQARSVPFRVPCQNPAIVHKTVPCIRWYVLL